MLANDRDSDFGQVLTVELVTSPPVGNLTLLADGSFTYVPAANANGAVQFTYRTFDGTTYSAPVTVTINVAALTICPCLLRPRAFLLEGRFKCLACGRRCRRCRRERPDLFIDRGTIGAFAGIARWLWRYLQRSNRHLLDREPDPGWN